MSISEEREDFTRKARRMLRKAYQGQLTHLRAVTQSDDAFRHHVGKHDAMDFSAPKNFVCAVTMDSAWQYGPAGCAVKLTSQANKPMSGSIRQMYMRLPSLIESERAEMPEVEALKACVKFIDSVMPHLGKIPADIGLLNDALIMARPLIEED